MDKINITKLYNGFSIECNYSFIRIDSIDNLIEQLNYYKENNLTIKAERISKRNERLRKLLN